MGLDNNCHSPVEYCGRLLENVAPFLEEDETLIRMEVRSFRLPPWLAPLLILAALALIPFALMLAFAVAGVAVLAGAARLFLPAPQGSSPKKPPFSSGESHKKFSEPSAIDVEYEARDEK